MTLLHSLRILDFSGLLPGPYATLMLADLGADVLRVESPTRPDITRNLPPMDGDGSVAHAYLNRNKRAIALDLKQPESIQLVKRLLYKYDIVLDQFRPGVMDRLGLGYDVLREVNPRVIYCSLTGYGQTGPYSDRPGHDNNYLAISGIASLLARKEGGPVPLGIQVADVAGGSLHTVIGILAAVIEREKTGRGQRIDISMTDASFALNALFGPAYLAGGIEVEPEATTLNGGSFYGYFQTKDGRYFSVGSMEPQFRKLFCETIGHQEWFELAMSENPGDAINFKEKIRDVFLSKTFEEWQNVFNGVPTCVEPVLTFSEACDHPQIKSRQMIVDVPKPDGTIQKQIGCPIKFSSYQPQYKQAGGKLGANTTEILEEELGVNKEEIENLRKSGAIR